MASLVTVADYLTRYPSTLDGDGIRQLEAHLTAASASVRRAAGRTFDYTADDPVELRGDWGDTLTLPNGPVVSVSSVTIAEPTETAETVDVYELVGGRLYRTVGWGGPNATVAVTYTHGFQTIPEDVVGIVCAVAGRSIANPSGLQSVAVGESYRVTFASGRSGAPTAGMLTEWERRYLRVNYGTWT